MNAACLEPLNLTVPKRRGSEMAVRLYCVCYQRGKLAQPANVNKVCGIFSQVLKLFSRGEFEKAVKEHTAERRTGFHQLGWAHSLREICGGLGCCEGQLKTPGSASGAGQG